MAYAAGVGGAKSSTVYPCGHMAYYESGSAPSVICPICGMQHQNAKLMQDPMMGGGGYTRQQWTTTSSNSTNVTFAQATGQMIATAENAAVLADDLKYPDLAWLNREISRYTKR